MAKAVSFLQTLFVGSWILLRGLLKWGTIIGGGLFVIGYIFYLADTYYAAKVVLGVTTALLLFGGFAWGIGDDYIRDLRKQEDTNESDDPLERYGRSPLRLTPKPTAEEHERLKELLEDARDDLIAWQEAYESYYATDRLIERIDRALSKKEDQ